MATKGKRPMRALTPGDKIEAIQRVNDGESKASVARDIGVPESTLRGWCKNEDKLRYMTSRLSSPDTDKSNDGEPGEKRARTESPVAAASPPPAQVAGLDLTATAQTAAPAPQPPPPPPPPAEAPIELTTTRRAEPAPPAHAPRDRRPDPGASVSMSAISPLSGLGHMPGLSHSHLGLSFNDIATNLTLLAQLNPGLTTLTAQPASRALRSVRSPKPAHNGIHNLGETKHHRSKSHHSDPYRHSSKSAHHHVSSSTPSQPMDDSLWYWLKTQQAMLDLTAQTTTAHPMLPKVNEPSLHPKPAPCATAPINPHLDYNRNSWLWQYYKQFGGAMPLPDDKHKSAQIPKDKTAENILYSHLTKGKDELERKATNGPLSLVQTLPPSEETRVTSDGEPRVSEPAAIASPGIGSENREPATERSHEAGQRSQAKARTVLDNLLFNNSNGSGEARSGAATGPGGEWEEGAEDALEHGDKFLAWLEASGDPSVTRMHVHQLRALLHNLRARRAPPTPLTPAPHDLASRRK